MNKIMDKIRALQQRALQFGKNADKVSAACSAIGKAWSGSSFVGHAKYFFRNFEEPKTFDRFSIEWGLINGIPDGWSERNDEEIRAKIENDSGVLLDDMKNLAIELESSFRDIQRDAILLLADEGFSEIETEKIEKFSIRSATDIFNSIFPTKYMTRDSEAVAGGYYITPHIYYDAVARFISGMPNELKDFLFEIEKLARKKSGTVRADDSNAKNAYYVENPIILSLAELKSDKFDVAKLIKMCKELNDNYSLGNYLSCGMLIRAILDHIPPVFGYDNFKEVANSYGTKSFRDVVLPLEDSARKISDSYLHNLIRKKEILPNKTQISFQPNMDFLLSEVIRVLSSVSKPKGSD